MVVSDIVYLITNLLVLYGMHIFCSAQYGRMKDYVLRMSALAGYLGADFLLYKVVKVTYIFAMTGILLYLFVTFAYSKRLRLNNLCIAAVFLVFGICSELLASYLVSLVMNTMNHYNAENALIVALIIARFLFFIMVLIAKRLNRVETQNYGVSSIPYLMLILPLLSIGLILYIFSLAEFDHHSILSTGSVGALCSVFVIVWINLLAFWLYDKQYRIHQMEQDSIRLHQTIQMQMEQYNEDKLRREAIQKMKHDYKNFLLAVRADIQTNHLEEAVDSINKKLETGVMNALPQSGLYPLDAVVGYKSSLAERKGIALQVEYRLEGEPQVSSEDICVMVGNALDNAIEYLVAHENCVPVIQIDTIYKKGVMHIHIKNPVCMKVAIEKGNEIVSTKNEKNHGYGLKTIDYIARKYGGELLLACDDKFFDCNIWLYC